MKRIFTIMSLLFFSALHAQNANLLWAKQMGSNNTDQGLAIAIDASGNVYTTGYFLSIADFNPDPAVTYNLTPAGGNDIFISKLDASGNFLWAKQLGGTNNDQGYSIAVDASGNVYTTGSFLGTADFNPDPAVTSNLISSGNDIFISKLDASGNFVWAKQLGGTNNDQGEAIAVDASGNVYTTGYFAVTADFNPDPAVTFNLTPAGGGSNDIFISKLDASGNFVWAKQLGGTSSEFGYSIAVDVSANVYTTGIFSGTADFNPDPAVTNNLITAGSTDVFVSKLDASGNFVWAKQLGGTSGETGYSIAVDASANVYTAGYFQGTVDFNPDPAVTNNLISAGLSDIFISKLDASGNFLFAKQLGGIGTDQGFAIVLDASRNIFTTGYFSSTADLDPDPAVTNSFTSAGGTDIFVVKLSQPGVLPINFTSMKAFQKNTGVQVEWNMATESNIRIYEIEKSLDGMHFTKAGTSTPTSNNNAATNYSWLDAYPFDGNNFYRLKAIETSGSFKYSSIIIINIRRGKSSIVINPNPVIDRTLNLQLHNQPKGVYSVRLFNNVGQLLNSENIQHPGGSSVQTLQISSKIAKGTYQVQVSNGEINIIQRVIL